MKKQCKNLTIGMSVFHILGKYDMLTLFFLGLHSAGSKVAAYIHTDVTKYDDNTALFKLAEKEFGGVDVCNLRYVDCFAAI